MTIHVEGEPTGPTLEDIRLWPATVSVVHAAQAFGLSSAKAYNMVREGKFPAKVVKAGGRYRVVTASIIRELS